MLGTVINIALFALGVLIAYDVLFEIVYRLIVRRYRYSVVNRDGFITSGLATNLTADGRFREKTVVVRLGWIAHWGVPNALDIMWQFQKMFPEWSIFVPSPPGFGGTTYPVDHLGGHDVTFKSFAQASMEGVIRAGARQIALAGASMGANIAAKEARALLEFNHRFVGLEAICSFAGVVEKMDPEELRRRFLHPMGLIDRLAIKWWKGGVPLSTRIATRGLIRATLHETLWDIGSRRKRWPLVGLYQNMLANTELRDDLLFLRRYGASVFASFGDRDRLTAEGHMALRVRYSWVQILHGETHLGLCVDGRYQAFVTKRALRPG